MSWSQIQTFRRRRNPAAPEGPPIFEVDEAKYSVQPFELMPERPNQVILVPALGRAGPFPFTAKSDGPIEVFYIKAVVYEDAAGVPGAPVTTYDIDWFFEHPGKKIQFMNRQLSLLACAGDGGRPYVLPESIFVPAVQSLNVTFFNNEAVARHVELVLGSIKFYHFSVDAQTKEEIIGYVARRERTYTYFQTTDNAKVSLTALQLGQLAGFVLPDSTDMEIMKLTAQSTGAFRCKITDGQNDRGLMQQRMHSSLLFGGHHTDTFTGLSGSGGIFPARWATSWLVRRAAQVQLEFDDLSGAPNTVDPVLAGRRISYA